MYFLLFMKKSAGFFLALGFRSGFSHHIPADPPLDFPVRSSVNPETVKSTTVNLFSFITLFGYCSTSKIP